MKSILTLPSFVTTTTDMTQFRSNRPSVPVCSLKNKELDSVALSARDLVAGMPRRLVTESEPLLTEEMPLFSFSALAEPL